MTTARSTCLPGKSRRAKTNAAGSASSRVSAVEASACQVVNHSTCRMSGWMTTSAIRPNCQPPSVFRPRATIAATGQAKNRAKNATGKAISPSRAALPRRVRARAVTSVRVTSTS
ncbi:DUF3648 domain-containing protein [Streptomyces sp. SID6137]|nr:DUF3648 domain-containing protein [Streptomyces sp. SID6137]